MIESGREQVGRRFRRGDPVVEARRGGSAHRVRGAAATAREISPSDAYRADNGVGTGLALVRARISPACRDALNAGQWPELAELLRKVLASGPRYRAEACLLPPPELLPDISAWV